MEGSPDLLIRGGMVVDGTGGPRFRADVAVHDGRLRLIREPRRSPEVLAGDVIDATDRIVAPGFIDLHSHSGLWILAEPRHEPKVRQGVTTEVVGVDGNAYAPFRSGEDLEAFARLNGGLDGRPDVALDWRSVADYLDRFDRGVAVNVAFVVGNSALRIDAVGWEDDAADVRAMDRMRGTLREAMQEGAFGLSSGLDYPPGSYASTDELAALTAVAARFGGFYHTHVRYPLGDRFLDPFREAIEIGRRGAGPVHITHLYHRPTYPGGPGELLELVDHARAEGMDVTFDMYPYEWAATRLVIQLPQWAQSGGPDALLERITDPRFRDRLRAEMEQRGAAYTSSAGWSDVRLGYFAEPDNAAWEGRTLADVMAGTGADAVDAICDLLITEDLRVAQVTSGPETETLPRYFAHPAAMIGTDSTFLGAKPSPRTYGSFPRVLGELVRDRRAIGLEEAVRKITSAPAARLGLRGRGRIADGMVADLVVFDPDRVAARATMEEPRRFPVGIEHVIVNGTPVVREGEHTGALPGHALRRGAD
jgi:N-acyl-D-amino-acid deacylase